MPTFFLPWSRYPNPGGEKPWPTPRQLLVRAAVFLALAGAAAALLGPGLVRAVRERSLRLEQDDLRRQDTRRTWQELELAVQSDPEDLLARRQLALFYGEAGLPAATGEWRELVRLDPANVEDRLWLARSSGRAGANPGGRGAAETLGLEAMARGTTHRIRATLELIGDATRAGDPRSVERLAKRILPPRPRSQLVWSWLVPARGLADLTVYMEAQPRPDAADASELAGWMCRQGMAPEALGWLDALGPALAANPSVQEARAECLVRMGNWAGLAAAVRAGAWGAVPGEAMDLAATARTDRDLQRPRQAMDAWNRALEAADRTPGGLRVMLSLASGIHWQEAAEAALWRLARAEPAVTPNWERLAALVTAEGSTQKLLEVYQSWALSGQDRVLAHGGVAWLSALLDRSAEGVLEAANSGGTGAIAAQALRLHRSGRASDGLALLAALPPSEQSEVRPTLVRGLLLSDLGQRDASEDALARIPEPQLLPEERSLLEAAHSRNGGARAP